MSCARQRSSRSQPSVAWLPRTARDAGVLALPQGKNQGYAAIHGCQGDIVKFNLNPNEQHNLVLVQNFNSASLLSIIYLDRTGWGQGQLSKVPEGPAVRPLLNTADGKRRQEDRCCVWCHVRCQGVYI